MKVIMSRLKYTHNFVHRRHDGKKVVLKSMSNTSSTTGRVKYMHNYIYYCRTHTKIVLNRVPSKKLIKPINSSSTDFVRKLMQLSKEKQQNERWDAAMPIEKLREERLSKKEDGKAKKLMSNNNTIPQPSGRSSNVNTKTTPNRGFFLENNYPCLSIYGEIRYLCGNGVLIDFHDMKPIEDKQITTEDGKLKYMVTPEKDRQMADMVYLSLHYDGQWKSKNKVVVRAPHWKHMLLINTFTFSNVVKRFYRQGAL